MSDETTQSEEKDVEETVVPVTDETQEAVAPEAPAPSPALAYKEKMSGMDDLQAGQTVRLHERIQDVSPKGEVRERIQVFEGIILALGGSGISRTITLRKISNGVGVEKIYPINSPLVSKIELIKTAKVRQAKLGFLKDLKQQFKRKLKEDYTELGVQKKKKGKK